jgi:hypothetical protein
MTRTAKLAIAVLGAIVLMLGGFAARAAIPSADGTITACYIKPTSNLRVINADATSCKKGETTLTWNQQGEPGTDGVSGYQKVERHARSDTTTDRRSFIEEMNCPDGKVVTGGGGNGSVINADGTFSYSMQLVASRPITDGDAVGWQIIFQHPQGEVIPAGADVRYDLFALCITAN